MNRRILAVLGATALLVATMIPAAAAARSPRFERVAIDKIDTKLIPAILDKTRVERVILELADKPVAVRQADAGRALAVSERATIRGEIRATQAKLLGPIKALGGKILAEYQDAYNGIKVQAPSAILLRLAALPGVVSVHKVTIFKLDNTVGIPYVGAPQTWQDTGFTGAGVKIGIIDTGIDYYHANFGGSGNPADFAADNGLTIGTPAFPNAKVAGGFDLVGDSYDADPTSPTYQPVPHPDPDPLDCQGHGSHVAGTAAGDGVLASGATYTGPYNAGIYGTNSFKIGPGVAPKAQIYAYRVFGCNGSTDVVVDAINRAVADGVDVINMSLGSDLGTKDTPDAVAANNAALAGVTVVTSAGNGGPNAFMVGSPSTADRAISVAALDAQPSFTGAEIDLAGGAKIDAINANAGSGLPLTHNLNVLLDGSGNISLGCAASDYALVSPGDVVVTARGICPRIDRAKFGQTAGASAVIMVNNASGLPPFEGDIPGVTIPFLGVDISADAALKAANETTVTISPKTITNPGFAKVASFSSGGPREVDNALKPDVTAPGVSVFSTAIGTGTGGEFLSGTSMASPLTAGVAALVTQAHPTWSAEKIKAAIMNTANASPGAGGIASPWNDRLAGAGVVRPREAVDTVGLATTGGGTASLSFGYAPSEGTYVDNSKKIKLWNTSSSPITYALDSGSPFITVPATIKVPAHGSVTFHPKLMLDVPTLAALPSMGAIATGSILTLRGAVTATPTVAGVGRYPLRVPFLIAPRGESEVKAARHAHYTLVDGVASSSSALRNVGIHAGDADVYSWGIYDGPGPAVTNDIRAVGVQSFPDGKGDAQLVFAVNTWGRFSSASDNEFDIGIDTNHDGKADFFVIGIDGGFVNTGSFDGKMLAFTVDTSGTIIDAFSVAAPSNGSTVELPTLASDLGLTSKGSSFDYNAAGFSIFGGPPDLPTGQGHFDALNPATSQGDFITLAPGSTASLPLWVNEAGFATTPSLGWMVVTLDDQRGAFQGSLINVGHLP